MLNLKLRNHKSVTFKVRSFAVPTRKTQTPKHTISAASNYGFTARKGGLESGAQLEPLRLTTRAGLSSFQEVILEQIDGNPIKRFFCFSTHQSGQLTNCIIAVTSTGVHYVALYGGLLSSPIPTQGITNFDCFAGFYSSDRDYLFAANSNGIYVADNTLIFKMLNASIRAAKQMLVFDKRLFILDADGETIYFTESLNLLEFAGSIRVPDDFGKVLSLDIYDGKLLVVCENGFKVLQTSFDQTKFKLGSLCRSYEKVIDGTVRAMGDTIYFLSSGGFCQAVRGKITLLDVDIASGGTMSSFVYDNKYYLSNGTRLAVIEKFTDSVSYYNDLGIRAFERVFNPFTERLAVLTDTQSRVFQIERGGDDCRIWESEDFCLTYASGSQYIRQVLVKTATPIDIVVTSNRAEQRVKVVGAPDAQKINLNTKGELFRIRIEAAGTDVNVSSLSVVVGF